MRSRLPSILALTAIFAVGLAGCLGAPGAESGDDAPTFPATSAGSSPNAAGGASEPERGFAYELLSARRERGETTSEGEVPMRKGELDRLRLVVRNHVAQDLDGFHVRFQVPDAFRVVEGDTAHAGILTPDGWELEVVVEATSDGRHVIEALVERAGATDVPAWIDYAIGCEEGACAPRSDAGATTATTASE